MLIEFGRPVRRDRLSEGIGLRQQPLAGKVQQQPDLKDTARVALTFRMTSLAKRKIQQDTDDEDDEDAPGQNNE